MKTLILYTTRHGAAREIARRIADTLSVDDIFDLADTDAVAALDLGQYDRFILGSAIYAGQIRKELKDFIAQNESDFKDKRFGFFLASLDEKGGDKAFSANFSEELLQSAQATLRAGGIFDPSKTNIAEKAVAKMFMKSADYVSTISEERIADFVQEMNA
jgi:menaquinone-dependent protoporphyrinogen IX oxidase